MKSMNRKVPLFYLLAIIIFMQSFIFGGILLLFWGCLIVGLCYSDILKIYLLSVLAIYIILLPFELFRYRDIRKICHDIKKNNIRENSSFKILYSGVRGRELKIWKIRIRTVSS